MPCCSMFLKFRILDGLCLIRAEEGDQILDGLMSITERKTVPQVFIKSEFIGGCDGESQRKCSWYLHLDAMQLSVPFSQDRISGHMPLLWLAVA